MNQYEAEKYLDYLSDTDEEFANAITAAKAKAFLIKKRMAQAFLNETGTGETRKQASEVDKDVLYAKRQYLKAFNESEILSAKRETARLRWEHWRSLEASRRVGGV